MCLRTSLSCIKTALYKPRRDWLPQALGTWMDDSSPKGDSQLRFPPHLIALFRFISVLFFFLSGVSILFKCLSLPLLLYLIPALQWPDKERAEGNQRHHHVPGKPSQLLPSLPSLTTNIILFQRIRGAIDARIAEEQARQRSAQEASVGRTNPARRPSTRTPRQRSNSTLPQTRGPDPTEFEFSIGDDDTLSGSSRSVTPRLETASSTTSATTAATSQHEAADGGDDEKAQSAAAESNAADSTAPDSAESKPAPTPELPIEVRAKLRRLDKIESKYYGKFFFLRIER
jgi:hypothetical protein